MTSLRRYVDIIDDFDAFEKICATPLPKTIWHNHAVCSAEIFREWIGGSLVPLKWCEGAYHVRDINRIRYYSAYLAGLFHVQEEASLIPVMLLNPQEGWNVLDLCAAPGNKTVQTALRVGEAGTVIANDVNRSRAGIIQTTLDRLSVSNVVTANYDAANFPYPGFLFDAVLADVPCSCEGTTRKNPHSLLRTNKKYREKLVKRQRRILERALDLCKPGGYVIYSTCTYAPEENEGVVSHVLNHSVPGRGVDIMPARINGLNSVPGISNWNGTTFHNDIARTLRIWPHLQDSGGFYAAILRKPLLSELISERAPVTVPSDKSSIRRVDCIAADAGWFGLDDVIQQQFKCLKLSNKYQSMVNSRVKLPERASIVFAGVRGVNTRGTTARISTAGAQLLGKYATRQKIDLSLSDVANYMTDHTVPIVCEGKVLPGRVIVSVKGIAVGLGTLKLSAGGNDFPVLSSLFPKSFGGLNVRDVLRKSVLSVNSG